MKEVKSRNRKVERRNFEEETDDEHKLNKTTSSGLGYLRTVSSGSFKSRKRKAEGRNFEEDADDEHKLKTTSSGLGYLRTVSSGSYVLTFFLVIVTLLIYDVTFVSQETVDVQAIKNDLLTNVLNQNDTIYLILDCLNEMLHHDQRAQIINFIGSSGVGKTFVANILKKYFYSIYELHGISYNDAQKNVINKLKYSSYEHNLVIVEDLTVADVDNLLLFLKEIPQDTVVFVICMFNIQETDHELNHKINYSHVDKIIEKFTQSKIQHKVTKFHEFNKKQAREWIEKQLIKKGINRDAHSQTIESILSQQDVTYHGLKGLSSKINLALM